jgi:hypothetical protein
MGTHGRFAALARCDSTREREKRGLAQNCTWRRHNLYPLPKIPSQSHPNILRACIVGNVGSGFTESADSKLLPLKTSLHSSLFSQYQVVDMFPKFNIGHEDIQVEVLDSYNPATPQ